MKRVYILWIVLALFLCTSGCTAEDDGILPPMENFSATEYEQYDYIFPPVASAVYRRGGKEEAVSPDDPRLIRLLNSLAYSWEQGYDAYLTGFITDERINDNLAQNAPMLEVYFQEGIQPPENTRCFEAKYIVICANAYMRIHDYEDMCETFQTSRYAGLYWPFHKLVTNAGCPFGEHNDWGDNTWIDLLKEAGF